MFRDEPTSRKQGHVVGKANLSRVSYIRGGCITKGSQLAQIGWLKLFDTHHRQPRWTVKHDKFSLLSFMNSKTWYDDWRDKKKMQENEPSIVLWIQIHSHNTSFNIFPQRDVSRGCVRTTHTLTHTQKQETLLSKKINLITMVLPVQSNSLSSI